MNFGGLQIVLETPIFGMRLMENGLKNLKLVDSDG